MDDDGNNPFHRIGPEEIRKAGNGSSAHAEAQWAGWKQISPVPQGVPEPPPSLLYRSPNGYEYTEHYVYRNFDSDVLCIVVRHTEPAKNGAKRKKIFQPVTLWCGPAGEMKWRKKALPAPHPMFGLDVLGAMPGARVVITEGEKKAIAALRLFSGYAAVSSPSGAGAARKADWTPLAGRDAVIWPDADEAGHGFAQAAAQAAYAAGAASVRIVQLPAGLPPKWDLADPLPDGFTVDDLRSWLETAEIVEKPEQADMKARSLLIGSDVEIARCVAKDMQERYGDVPFCEGQFWRYAETRWEPIPENDLRLMVHVYDGAEYSLGDDDGIVKLSKNRINSILHECAVILADPEFFAGAATGINCRSGFVRIDASGTPHLDPHDRGHRARHTLPGRWRPGTAGAPPPGSMLHKLLYGSFLDDPNADAKIDLLAEICGAAALGYGTKLRQPKAAMLYGSTAENGKSQVLNLIYGLLPSSAICSVPPAKMSDERHVIGLAGKLLNATNELSGESIAGETFKTAITGEMLSGRDVFKSRVEFVPIAQHVFACNQLPSFKGGVDRGIQRRLMVISFLRTVPPHERIEDIGKRIAIEEADLLLAWAIEGASRIVRNHNFTIPKACSLELTEWLVSDDVVIAWIDACLISSDTAPPILMRAVYEHFRNWAASEGYKPDRLPPVNHFVTRLMAQKPNIKRKRINGARLLSGIVLSIQ